MIIWRTNFLLLFLLIFPFQQNVSRRKTKARRRFPTCFLFRHLSDVPALLYLACFILLAFLQDRKETRKPRVYTSRPPPHLTWFWEFKRATVSFRPRSKPIALFSGNQDAEGKKSQKGTDRTDSFVILAFFSFLFRLDGDSALLRLLLSPLSFSLLFRAVLAPDTFSRTLPHNRKKERNLAFLYDF